MSFRRLLLQSLRRPPSLSQFSHTGTKTFTRPYMGDIYQEKFERYYRRRRFGGVISIEALNFQNNVISIIHGGDIDHASAVVCNAIISNNRPTIKTCLTLLSSMHKAGRYEEVVKLFNFFFKEYHYEPDPYSYNILMKAHVDAGNIDKALKLYHYMLEEAPYAVKTEIYDNLTRGLVSSNQISKAREILEEMVHGQRMRSPLVYNNLISGYLDINDVKSANELFNKLLNNEYSYVDDGVIFVTYMDYYFKHNMEKEAMDAYHIFMDKYTGVVPKVYNMLLKVLLKNDKSAEANSLFDFMLNSDTDHSCYRYNIESYNIMVNECFRLGKVSEALLIFKKKGTYDKPHKFVMDASGYNNIIDKLCGIGMVTKADKLFEDMLSLSVVPDVTTFRILFEAFTEHGRINDMLIKLNYMLFETKLKPSSALVNSVIGRVISKGMIEEAGEILRRMKENGHESFPTTCRLALTGLCNEVKRDQIDVLFGRPKGSHEDVQDGQGVESTLNSQQPGSPHFGGSQYQSKLPAA